MHPTTTTAAAVQFLQKHISPSITSSKIFSVLTYIILALLSIHIYLSERDRKLVKSLQAENAELKDELADSDELVEELDDQIEEMEFRIGMADLMADLNAGALRMNQQYTSELRDRCSDLAEMIAEVQMEKDEMEFRVGMAELMADLNIGALRMNQRYTSELRDRCLDLSETIAEIQMEKAEQALYLADDEADENCEESDEDPEFENEDTASELESADVPELEGEESTCPTYSDSTTLFLKALIQNHLLFGKPLSPTGSCAQFDALFHTDDKLLSLYLYYYLAFNRELAAIFEGADQSTEVMDMGLEYVIRGDLSSEHLLPEEEELLNGVLGIDHDLRSLWLECYGVFEGIVPGERPVYGCKAAVEKEE